jgi:hypothetical protein
MDAVMVSTMAMAWRKCLAVRLAFTLIIPDSPCSTGS